MTRTAAPVTLMLALLASAWVAAGESWVSEYPRIASLAERDCAGPRLADCRHELRRIADLLDNRTDVLYRLSKVEARLGHAGPALAYLKSYVHSRLDLGDPAAQPEFEALRTNADFQHMEQIYREGLAPEGTHVTLARAPSGELVAEDLAIDARSGVRYLSSVHLGKVLALDAAGHWSDFIGGAQMTDTWGLYSLSLDAPRARLWISTVAGPTSPPFRAAEQGRSAILRVNLKTHVLERRYELKDGRAHAFGDTALGARGELYVSDGVGGGLYRIDAEGAAAMSSVLDPGALRSPQSPVPVPGGQRLMVADYTRGIAIVDLQHPKPVSWLAHAPELAVYGIDGLYLHGRCLIAVQNGTQPERLLVMRLDSSLTRVLTWHVALSRAAGLGDPTHGVIRDNQFEFIANSGWDHVDDQGHFNPSAATAPSLWAIELGR